MVLLPDWAPKIAGEVVLMAVSTRKALAEDKSGKDSPMLKLDGKPRKERKKSGGKRERVSRGFLKEDLPWRFLENPSFIGPRQGHFWKRKSPQCT